MNVNDDHMILLASDEYNKLLDELAYLKQQTADQAKNNEPGVQHDVETEMQDTVSLVTKSVTAPQNSETNDTGIDVAIQPDSDLDVQICDPEEMAYECGNGEALTKDQVESQDVTICDTEQPVAFEKEMSKILQNPKLGRVNKITLCTGLLRNELLKRDKHGAKSMSTDSQSPSPKMKMGKVTKHFKKVKNPSGCNKATILTCMNTQQKTDLYHDKLNKWVCMYP